jgi:hypothetical protein
VHNSKTDDADDAAEAETDADDAKVLVASSWLNLEDRILMFWMLLLRIGTTHYGVEVDALDLYVNDIDFGKWYQHPENVDLNYCSLC